MIRFVSLAPACEGVLGSGHHQLFCNISAILACVSCTMIAIKGSQRARESHIVGLTVA